MTTVPVIDIGPFLTGGTVDRLRVAKDIAYACEQIGFFQIIGHGIETGLVDDVYDVSRQFFDLPEAAKMAVAQPSPDVARGWSAVGQEGLSYSMDSAAPGDLKEKLDIGTPNVPRAGGSHFPPNLWTGEIPRLQPLWERYFTAMSELCRQVMSAFALGLDLSAGFFDDKINEHISTFRAINYPDQPFEPLAGQLRAGVHTDYGSLTIVRQEDRPGGLQVMDKSGDWVDVPVVPGGFVVNIGDLMAEWTNDRWVSTLHRVVNPGRDRATDSRRISLVFFHQPNYDAVIECLPSCLAAGEQPRYEPITSGEHLMSKFVKQTTFGAA